MDEAVVNRVKRASAAAWLGVTGVVLAGWGFQAAAVAAAAFLAISFLAFLAFILNLLLGDAPVAWRILMIALVLVGLLIEIGAVAAALGWLLRGAAG